MHDIRLYVLSTCEAPFLPAGGSGFALGQMLGGEDLGMKNWHVNLARAGIQK